MRARIIAFIFLFIIVVLPLSFYWYFMMQKESSLIITPSRSDIDYTLSVKGTLSYSFLPLADKFLEFQKECHGVCILSPIPPVKYDILITSTGYVESQKTLTLTVGLKEEFSYEMLENLRTRLLDASPSVEIGNIPSEYTLLSALGGEKNLLVKKKMDENITLGLLSGDAYRLLRTLPPDTEDVIMDATQQYIIVQGASITTLISRNFSREVELPRELGIPTFVSYYNSIWKVRVEKGIFEKRGNIWEENIRFTDYIDISPYKRIGYIAPTDSERLSLSNLPSGTGVFVSLDRKTGKSYVIQRGIEIEGFFYNADKPAYRDMEGNTYTIDNK